MLFLTNAIPMDKVNCLRCGHSWRPRNPGRPTLCPECGNAKWDHPKGSSPALPDKSDGSPRSGIPLSKGVDLVQVAQELTKLLERGAETAARLAQGLGQNVLSARVAVTNRQAAEIRAQRKTLGARPVKRDTGTQG